MMRFIVFAALAVIGWKLVTGRWPWEPKRSARAQALSRARQLLGVPAGASREDILSAHRRQVSLVHPDRGGSDRQVHEVTAARDLLLDAMPSDPEIR